MSKAIIDYSNTVFYKIYCKDTNIDDVYIGHTINFVQRKQAHKTACNKSSDPSHNFKVYKFIREQGGWDNWNMDMIGFKNCKDRTQACIIEQEYFESHKASLNSVLPYKTPTERLPVIVKEKLNLYCEVCKIDCNCRNSFEKHKSTKKHQRLENVQNNTDIPTSRESSFKFHCELCDFKCGKRSNYQAHLMTTKHKNKFNKMSKDANHNGAIESEPVSYACKCGKTYSARNSLWYHKRKCTFDGNNVVDISSNINLSLMEVFLQNQEQHNNQIQEIKEQHNNQIQEIKELILTYNKSQNNCL
jgi:hypothetical protein